MRSAKEADDAVRRRFVGMWRLVGAYQHGGAHPDRGAGSTGYIVYDASGHMAVQVMPGHHRPPFADPQHPTADEALAAFRGYIAYFGTWQVDAAAATVTHVRTGCLNPSTIAPVVRRYSFEGEDRVTLNPLEVPQNTITWQRVR